MIFDVKQYDYTLLVVEAERAGEEMTFNKLNTCRSVTRSCLDSG